MTPFTCASVRTPGRTLGVPAGDTHTRGKKGSK